MSDTKPISASFNCYREDWGLRWVRDSRLRWSLVKAKVVRSAPCETNATQWINQEVPRHLDEFTCTITSTSRSLIVLCQGRTKTSP